MPTWGTLFESYFIMQHFILIKFYFYLACGFKTSAWFDWFIDNRIILEFFCVLQIEGAGSNYWHHLSVRQWFSLQFLKIQLEDSLDGHKAVFSIWVRNMSDRVPILAVGLNWASLSIWSCFVLFHQALFFTLISLGCRWW